MPIIRIVLFIIAILIAPTSWATETSTLNSSVRALGMGDAFTALADDSSSLFYNPAGLARVRGINWRVFDVGASGNDLQSFKKFADLKGASSGNGFATKLQELYGSHIHLGVGGESIFTVPMVGFGVYNHLSTTIQVNNPVYPKIHTRVINDYGYVLGVGFPVAPVLHFGVGLKYIKRTGLDKEYGPSFIADLDPSKIVNDLTAWGTGYGADLGMTVLVPTPVMTASMSVAWKNVGGINFKSGAGSSTEIPSEPNNMTLGVGLDLDLVVVSVRPAVDVVYLNDPALQLTRKLNFGVEVGLPLIDIRGGFHEGYASYGVGVNLGLFRVDAASYGVELGDYPGQIEDRRYVAQFTMELGVGNFGVSGSAGKKGAEGGSKSKASSDSIWGGRRLKQRR